jgi:peptide chain release factor 3
VSSSCLAPAVEATLAEIDAVDAPCVLLEYAGELRAMQENWPKIKFHALREHAGLVFQKQLQG